MASIIVGVVKSCGLRLIAALTSDVVNIDERRLWRIPIWLEFRPPGGGLASSACGRGGGGRSEHEVKMAVEKWGRAREWKFLGMPPEHLQFPPLEPWHL